MEFELMKINRMVVTPLWTDRPDKVSQFGVTDSNALTPDQVAQSMLDLVTEEKYPGGTMLETTVAGQRVLGTWNIEKPSSTDRFATTEAGLERNLEPIRRILREERGAGIEGNRETGEKGEV